MCFGCTIMVPTQWVPIRLADRALALRDPLRLSEAYCLPASSEWEGTSCDHDQ